MDQTQSDQWLMGSSLWQALKNHIPGNHGLLPFSSVDFFFIFSFSGWPSIFSASLVSGEHIFSYAEIEAITFTFFVAAVFLFNSFFSIHHVNDLTE